jgi:hypothetical protein
MYFYGRMMRRTPVFRKPPPRRARRNCAEIEMLSSIISDEAGRET